MLKLQTNAATENLLQILQLFALFRKTFFSFLTGKKTAWEFDCFAKGFLEIVMTFWGTFLTF